MKYTFRELVDTAVLGTMLERLYAATNIPSAIIDMEGNVLSGAGWQRICTQFHRVHPEAKKLCVASDVHIVEEIRKGQPYAVYECPHGLVDSSCPVVIEGEHVANVFTGQMLHAPPDKASRERFRRQAEHYGFDADDYLRALDEVPVYPIEKHQAILEFLSGFARQVAGMGLANLRALEQAKASEESEERFRLVMDSLESLIYVADMETYEVLFVNRYGRELLGDITGKICWQTIQTGQHSPCGFCTNKHLLDAKGQAGDVYTWEHQYARNGHWYSVHDRAIRWVDGRMVRLEIATDITERKRAREDADRLEARLRQAQKMEALGTLAGGIAHDFNNILSVIIGSADLATLSLADEHPARENIANILGASCRAKDIVKQILAFSRKDIVEKKPLFLCRLVEESLKTLRATTPSSVELKVDIPAGCHVTPSVCRQIQADPTQIHQLILNLCTNSIQAMGERGVLQITVSEVHVGEDESADALHLDRGIYVRLSVADTGCGIDQETQKKIFDPFFTTKEVGAGTGLGLAVVHGIVEHHGGKIIVESEPGRGTTFHVYFPSQKAEPPGRVPESRELPRGTEHILFVDDEPLLVETGRELLSALGYRVSAVLGSAAALETFREKFNTIDAVITDQTMPGMTGIDLASELRNIKADVPVILCTGYSNLVTEETARGLGIARLCMKPLSLRDLASILREVLDEVPVPRLKS
jgi:two-component system cell cycle sensor histidine kinase/response regulator CckA